VEGRVRSAGELGFVGVVVQLLGLLPVGLLTPVGFLLELVALRRLSEAFNSSSIWSNAWRAVVFAVVAAALFEAGLFIFLLRWPSLPLDYRSPLHLLFLFLAVFSLFVGVYEFVVLAGSYYRDVYRELAGLSGVAEFEAAARWTWRGASLFAAFVGGPLALVGRVYALLGYRSLRGWDGLERWRPGWWGGWMVGAA